MPVHKPATVTVHRFEHAYYTTSKPAFLMLRAVHIHAHVYKEDPYSRFLHKNSVCSAELHLSGRWLSGSPIMRIGLAFPVNIVWLQLYCIFLWLKIPLQNFQVDIRNYILMVYSYVNKYISYNSRLQNFFSTSNCQCRLFWKKNPIIRIFCISGRLVVPIITDNWSSGVFLFSPILAILLVCCQLSLPVWLPYYHPINE